MDRVAGTPFSRKRFIYPFSIAEGEYSDPIEYRTESTGSHDR